MTTRTCAVVTGYHVHATDGEIGRAMGFLVDEITWAIRYYGCAGYWSSAKALEVRR
jgi:hypothetical protein